MALSSNGLLAVITLQRVFCNVTPMSLRSPDWFLGDNAVLSGVYDLLLLV